MSEKPTYEELEKRVAELEAESSARKRAEEALRESEERFRKIFEDGPFGVVLTTRDKKFFSANPAFCRMLGYTSEEMNIRTFLDVTHPEDRDIDRKNVEKMWLGEIPHYNTEKRYIAKNGGVRWGSLSSFLIRGPGGDPIYALAMIKDITEHKQAEEALRENEEKFRAIFEQASVGVSEVDTKSGRFIRINQKYCDILGYSLAEMMESTYMQITHPDDLEADLNNNRKIGEGQTSLYARKKRYIRKDGSIVWVDLTVSPIWEKGERTTHHIAVVEDITERKRIEEALRDSEEAARQKAEVDRTLAAIGRIISSTLTIDEVYEQFAAEVKKFIPLDRINIGLIDAESGTFGIEYTTGIDIAERLKGQVLPLPELVREAMRRKSGILLQPEHEEEFLEDYPDFKVGYRAGIRSVIVEPLISGDEVIGVLYFASMSPNAYLERHLILAQKVASQIVGAIANARLYDQVKTTEKALRESETRYKTIFEQNRSIMFIHDPETGNFMDVNPAACSFYGYSREEMLEMKLSRILHDNPDQIIKRTRETLSRGSNYFTTRHYLKSGESRDVEVYNNVIMIGDKKAIIGILHDITDRKKAEEALARRSEFERLVSKISSDLAGMRSKEIDAGINRALASITTILGADRAYVFLFHDGEKFALNTHEWCTKGVQPETGNFQDIPIDEEFPWFSDQIRIHEVCHVPDVDAMPPEARLERRHFSAQGIKSLIVVPMRLGSQLAGFLRLDAVREQKTWTDEDLFLLRLVAETFSNVIKRHRTEEALLESEEKFKTVSEQSPNMIFINRGGAVVYANMRCEEVTGYKRDEFYAPDFDFLSLIAPEYHESVKMAFEKHSRGQDVEPFEYILLTKKGERINAMINSKLISYRGDLAILGIVTDITQYKQAVEALRKNEKRYKDLYDNAPAGYLEYDMEGRITQANQTLMDMLGYERKEIVGDFIWRINDHEDMAMDQVLAKLADTRPPDRWLERAYRRKDGTTFPVLIDDRLVRDEENRIKGIRCTIQDITELKRAEEDREELHAQLLQAQKMESIGRLAGGVAHDFNNMLSVILGHAQLALSDSHVENSIRSSLEEIFNAAKRSTDITRQLLAFARKQTIDPVVLDLNETVEGTLKMLRRLIGEDIGLAWHPSSNIWPVKMDPAQIDQILANLCVNAKDAIKGAGKITIETENILLDEAYCAEHPGFSPGEFTMLAVIDDGSGMAKETLANVFEPFFTTKEVGKGTGLGLSTVYGIVKQNNGFINAHSEPGKGTSFKIYLPRCVGEAISVIEETSHQMLEGYGETILIVEDEKTVLDVVKQVLERSGYTVVPAVGAREAIEIIQGYSEEIHLLLTDVVMPEMDGKKLAEQAVKTRPNIKTLFMSGYTSNGIVHHGLLDKGVHFIRKPLIRDVLLQKVRDVLDH